MGLILPNSGELLLALEIAAVRAEALLSPDLHVEHSPLNDANVRVCFFHVLRIFREEQLAEQFWYFNFSLYLAVLWAEQ